MTPPSSDDLLPAPGSPPQEAPVSFNGVVACDINLLNSGADLSLLAIPLLPLQ